MNRTEYQAKRQAIINNGDLSEAGKGKQLAALEAYSQDVMNTTLRELQTMWNYTRGSFADHERLTKEAQEREAARWDYNRLNYQQEAVKAAIANAHDIQEVKTAYSQARQSGDKHTARAWAEFLAGNVTAKFGADIEAVDLLSLAAHDLAALVNTPELAALNVEGERLAAAAIKLHRETIQAINEYADGWQMGFRNEFTALLDGVNLSHSAHPNGGVITSITIE